MRANSIGTPSMSAAAFILAINLFIAGVFATAFGVIAAYARSAIGARWLAAAYGLGILNAALEFALPFQADPRAVGVGIFTAFLLAISLSVVGLSRHYRLDPPWRTLGVLIVVSVAVNTVIIDMPRTSMLRATLYQLPYFAVQMVGVVMILRARQRQALDRAMLVLYFVAGLHFLAKPVIASIIGSGASPQAYLTSTYAAISQSLGAMLLIANGLLMLLIIVRDVMAEMTTHSETDKLSGLLNRRGFEDRANKALATTVRAGVPGAVIVADLDHFKAINDTHGHEAGDRVIAACAEVLAATSDARAVIGRMGGEEFAAMLPGANLSSARLYAESVRGTLSSISIASLGPGRRVSASFGVAQLQPDDSLSDLLRRADAALYEAKKGGRDRVCTAPFEPVPVAEVPDARRNSSRAQP